MACDKALWALYASTSHNVIHNVTAVIVAVIDDLRFRKLQQGPITVSMNIAVALPHSPLSLFSRSQNSIHYVLTRAYLTPANETNISPATGAEARVVARRPNSCSIPAQCPLILFRRRRRRGETDGRNEPRDHSRCRDRFGQVLADLPRSMHDRGNGERKRLRGLYDKSVPIYGR